MPDTGIDAARTAAGIPLPTPMYLPGYQPRSTIIGIPSDVLASSDCVCVAEWDPEVPTGQVIFQSACQRPEAPGIVDVSLLVKGQGTFVWNSTNSGFSLDGGATWHALSPLTGDPRLSSLTSYPVTGQDIYNMVLDMDDHIDDFLTGQDDVIFRVSFTVS